MLSLQISLLSNRKQQQNRLFSHGIDNESTKGYPKDICPVFNAQV